MSTQSTSSERGASWSHIPVTNKRGIKFVFKNNPIVLKANKLSFCPNNFNTIGLNPLKTNKLKKTTSFLYGNMRNLVQFVQIREIANRLGGFAKDKSSPFKY